MPEPDHSMHACMGSAAHALNNVLNVLYAAASYLERPDDAVRAARARMAVENAGGSIQALSAATSLLALDAADVAAVGPLQGRSAPIRADDFEHMSEALRAVANAGWQRAPEAGAAGHWSLPQDIVEALLICAAVALKRSAPAGAELSCSVSADTDAPPGLVFELRVAAPAAEVAVLSPHPCGYALEYAAQLFAELGVRIDLQPGRSARVRIAIRDAA